MMKTIDDIQGEIKAICDRLDGTLSESCLLALAVYVSQQAAEARQNVFNAIIEQLDKKGV